ncbi:MAG: ABC transporter permease subunit [Planctomycetota bacterium]
MNDQKRNAFEFAVSAALILGVAGAALLAWETVIWAFDLPKALLPTPRQCLAAAESNRDALVRGIIGTGTAAVAGLLSAVVIGSFLAIAFSQSRKLRLALFPYVILLQTIPVVAIAPLLIIWSGYTFRTVVIVTVIVCLFPIVNSVTAGLMSASREATDLFQLYGASRRQRLWRLQIPSAIPHLMVGVRTSSALSVIGAIVAEFFVGNGTSYNGLGTLMTGWQGLMKTDALIAALFASAMLGLVIFGIVQLISKQMLGRWTSD